MSMDRATDVASPATKQIPDIPLFVNPPQYLENPDDPDFPQLPDAARLAYSQVRYTFRSQTFALVGSHNAADSDQATAEKIRRQLELNRQARERMRPRGHTGEMGSKSGCGDVSNTSSTATTSNEAADDEKG